MTNKVALIIGAGDSLGSSIARVFASDGFTVVVARRNGDKLSSLAEEIRKNGGECFFYSLDARKEDDVINLINKIDPMVVQKHSLDYVEDKHQLLSQNTTSVQQQIEKLSYDTEYSNRILQVNRILSFYTPKEIKISLIKFQKGWDVKGYKKIGRDLVPVVQKEDEHLRVVRLAGSVNSNPALLESHFNNFVAMLEETNLFKNIKVVEQASKESLGPEFLQFDLKCVL
mgnify:CR=1 FL=1